MQVHDDFINCVAFVGTPTDGGFAANGTAFILRVPYEGWAFHYFVTCRHVVMPTLSKRDLTPNNDPIWIRINKERGPPAQIKTIRSEWIRHSDKNVDVCVYQFDTRKHDPEHQLQISSLNIENIIFTEKAKEVFGLCLGDELFIVGCFVGRVGEKNNIPIVRTASLAAKPTEPVWGGSPSRPAYLVETRSMGGTSGSPVFLHLTPNRVQGNAPKGLSKDEAGYIAPYLLIGMMQGMHSGQYAYDFVSDDDDEFVVPKDADFNAGIGITIPIDQIMEVINRDDFVEARQRTIEEINRRSGHHDTSAGRLLIST
jgi:hypothetical protein